MTPAIHPVIDVVIPARNEAPTVAEVVEAALGCRYIREVLVVDDGSTDGTADLATAAGAKVVRREPGVGGLAGGSKAHALEAGVVASDADAFLFCDADLVGLTAAHLDGICRPFVEGRATMSVGWFDYGLWNPLVVRLAPTTGERVVPRWVWDAVPDEKRQGYSIEIMINEVIAEGRLPTTARTLHGVTHRTKRDKLGRRSGYRETCRGRWFAALEAAMVGLVVGYLLAGRPVPAAINGTALVILAGVWWVAGRSRRRP